MITEDYVSFETAKLLKEKGYWNMATMLYKENGDIVNYNVPLNNKGFSSTLGVFYEAPTLQMAMKWLREKNIFINIYHYNFRKAPFVWIIFAYNKLTPQAEQTYEQAAESAIKYILENWDDVNEVLEKYYKNDEILPKI